MTLSENRGDWYRQCSNGIVKTMAQLIDWLAPVVAFAAFAAAEGVLIYYILKFAGAI